MPLLGNVRNLRARSKDGHTSIGFSADVTYAPISHKRIGDKIFVTGVYSDEYAQKGVRHGTELVVYMTPECKIINYIQ